MTEKISKCILSATNLRRKWQPLKVGETLTVEGEYNSQSIKIYDAKAVTEDTVTSKGKVYLLEDLQEDYKAFIQAIEENIPVIENWDIDRDEEDRYIISGFIGNTEFKQRIIRADGNIVEFEDGKRYFIQWRYYSDAFSKRMFMEPVAAGDIKFPEQFDWYGDCRCKPRIIVR